MAIARQQLALAEAASRSGGAALKWGARPGDCLSDDRTPAILIVESSAINRRLIRAMLRGEGYRTFEAGDAAEAFDLLGREAIDLIVLELVVPGMDGLDFCRAVKANRTTRFVPVLIMTSLNGAENEIAGISSGGDEFLVKPLHPNIVRTRIRAMLRHKAAIDSLEEAESILFALAQAVEHRDRCTAGHCERLAALSVTLGMVLGLPKSQLLALHRGGYLHDIGKIGIPDAILFKPGPLTEEEWAVMRTHSARGEEICRPARTLGPVLPIIRNHHERWDGTGYPDGLSGEEIPLLARILQTADVFDALTSARPYKPPLPAAEALDILDAEARRGWRDPALVAVLQGVCDSVDWNAPDPMSQSLENMRRVLSR